MDEFSLLIAAALVSGTPPALAGLGLLINERAGVLNLGGEGIMVRRGVEDQKAFDAGRNNVTTARGLGRLLTAIERGEAASAWATATMREILLRQEFNDEIPAGLPAGVPVGVHPAFWDDEHKALRIPPGT